MGDWRKREQSKREKEIAEREKLRRERHKLIDDRKSQHYRVKGDTRLEHSSNRFSRENRREERSRESLSGKTRGRKDKTMRIKKEKLSDDEAKKNKRHGDSSSSELGNKRSGVLGKSSIAGSKISSKRGVDDKRRVGRESKDVSKSRSKQENKSDNSGLRDKLKDYLKKAKERRRREKGDASDLENYFISNENYELF